MYTCVYKWYQCKRMHRYAMPLFGHARISTCHNLVGLQILASTSQWGGNEGASRYWRWQERDDPKTCVVNLVNRRIFLMFSTGSMCYCCCKHICLIRIWYAVFAVSGQRLLARFLRNACVTTCKVLWGTPFIVLHFSRQIDGCQFSTKCPMFCSFVVPQCR